MKYLLCIAAFTAAAGIFAGPLAPRAVDAGDFHVTDLQILNYALTLEHLEAEFYRQGLVNYTCGAFLSASQAAGGTNDRGAFCNNLKEIASDEATHVQFLEKALGKNAVMPCTYSFPSIDAASFVTLASVLEGVGVSAYLGAAQFIKSKAYLTDAAAILTIEARHNAYLRSDLKELPFAQPFDTPLDFNEVYTLAAGFITSCPPENKWKPQIHFKPFPTLSLSPKITWRILSGSNIVLNTPGYQLVAPKHKQLYATFITLTGPIYVPAVAVPDNYFGGGFLVRVPDGVNGQTYVVITECHDGPLKDSSIAAGPAIVEVTNNNVYGLYAGASATTLLENPAAPAATDRGSNPGVADIPNSPAAPEPADINTVEGNPTSQLQPSSQDIPTTPQDPDSQDSQGDDNSQQGDGSFDGISDPQSNDSQGNGDSQQDDGILDDNPEPDSQDNLQGDNSQEDNGSIDDNASPSDSAEPTSQDSFAAPDSQNDPASHSSQSDRSLPADNSEDVGDNGDGEQDDQSSPSDDASQDTPSDGEDQSVPSDDLGQDTPADTQSQDAPLNKRQGLPIIGSLLSLLGGGHGTTGTALGKRQGLPIIGGLLGGLHLPLGGQSGLQVAKRHGSSNVPAEDLALSSDDTNTRRQNIEMHVRV